MTGSPRSEVGILRGPRLHIWQARDEYPDRAYAVLGGAFAHAIRSRLALPTGFCFALCGEAGFAEADATDDDQLCLRCQRRLEKATT